MTTDFDLPPDSTEAIRRMFAYWDGKRASRACPARRDIEPADIPDLLPHISLVDVRAAEPRFVYRLVGTGNVKLLGKELTGKPVGTGVKPGELARVLARYDRVARTMRPFFHRDPLQEENDDYTLVERLMLPLSEDGAAVNIILVCVCPRV